MSSGWTRPLADLPQMPVLLLKVSGLLALGWIVHLIFRRRNPRWRVALWRGVAVGLTVLPLLGLALPELRLGILPAEEPEITPVLVPIQRGTPRMGMGFAATSVGGQTGWAAVPAPVAAEPKAGKASASVPHVSAMEWVRSHYAYLLGSAWGGVVVILIALAVKAHRRSRRIVRNSRPAPEGARRILQRTARDLKCRRDIVLRCSLEVPSPLLTGILKPCIILPQSMAEENAVSDLEGVLAHELAHLKSRDLFWSRFLQALSILLWFHPFTWRIRRAHAVACEEACDAAAAHYVGDAEEYSGTLARVALGLLGERRALAGIPMARKPQIRRRLEMLRNKIWSSQLHRRVAVILLLAGVIVLAGLAGLKLTRAEKESAYAYARATSKGEPGSRVVRFPQNRSLGALYVQDASVKREIESFYHWINGTSWEYLGEARGEVIVPAGMNLRLTVSPTGWQDLSPLSYLSPDDLYSLSFLMLPAPGPKPDDRCMPPIAHLTGLKELALWESNITDKGMSFVTKLKSLERLTLPKTTDAGMAYVGQLTSLKGLYFKENAVTNSGLAQLASLKSLEELDLGGGYVDAAGRHHESAITDAGLVHLANLPNLSYLLLWGQGFSEAGLVHIANVPSLKTLNMHQYQVTDAGLEHLSRLPKLEVVSFSGPPISDKGFGYLEQMRSLRILGAPLGDNALANLKEIKSLEYLDLPGEKMTDKEMAYLSEFPNLKHLKMSMPHYIDPKAYKGYYTDEGLKELARAPLLEELFLAGPGVTDAGMAHVAKLANLRELSLFGCPVTGQGLAKLTALKSLNKAWMYVPNMTIGDLAELNGIPSLTEVSAMAIKEKKSPLNIAGLTQLESLRVEARKPCILGDEDLACLAKLTRLRDLALSPCEFSDVGVKHLAGLTSLERLWIGGPGLADEGLKCLKGMTKLDYLGLTGDFTDEGLRHLEGLKGLRTLNITSEGAFSNAALDRLRRELPNLQTLTVIP
ncbi:MAG: M56 family metallopeptidase [bacterium]|nr:M56 family metallopeptidase [bacterium]